MSKKTSPEEELEKQYREYKAQFEKWREENKGSEGSEGYISYVKQFEKWERDVETRRRSVRAKSEQERRQQAIQEQQKQQNDDEAAAKYAEQQKSYVAMHQKAMLEEERQRQKRQNPTQPQHVHADEMVKRGPHIQAEPQPLSSSQNLQKSALWGPDGAEFPPTDPMCVRWGIRAAPPNFKVLYDPPASDAPINPSWYLMKKMEEQGLFYGYNVNLNGVPEISTEGIPSALIHGVKDTSAMPSNMPGNTPLFSAAPVNRTITIPPPPTDFSIPPPNLK